MTNTPPEIILQLPHTMNKPLYKTMWAQISGMADNCSAGVIGRLGGQIIHESESRITVLDMKNCSQKYKVSNSFRHLVLELMPQNRVFAGPPEWLFWLVLEDVVQKYTTGVHTPTLKPASVSKVTFDFEKNPYHKFWAGPGYRVKMWFMSDKVGIQGNKFCRVNSFRDFVKKGKLGYIIESKPIKASYSGEVTGMIFTPDCGKITQQIGKELKIANEILKGRWDKVKQYKNHSTITSDKVAQKW